MWAFKRSRDVKQKKDEPDKSEAVSCPEKETLI